MDKDRLLRVNNKLIAEFMGEQVISSCPKTYRPNLTCYRESELSYNSSWDWLMPVVEKISKIYDISSYLVMDKMRDMPIFELSIFAELDIAYEAVVKFIKWHNDENS